MASIMELITEQLKLYWEEQMVEFERSRKNLIEDTFKELKRQWGDPILLKKDRLKAASPPLQIEQSNQEKEDETLELDYEKSLKDRSEDLRTGESNQEKEDEILEPDYEKSLKDRSEDLRTEAEQETAAGHVDTQIPKDYKTLIKAQQEGFELTDLIKGKQQDSDNFDQFKVFVSDTFLVRKHNLGEMYQGRIYFKVIRKVPEENLEYLRELMLQGEEYNAQNVSEGLEKDWTGLGRIIIRQILKYIFQFDSKD